MRSVISSIDNKILGFDVCPTDDTPGVEQHYPVTNTGEIMFYPVPVKYGILADNVF